MKKGTLLVATILAVASRASAQTPADSLAVDNADFTFTESQLDEDNDAQQTISAISSKKDPYLSEVGYAFSAVRFRVRAYDNLYSSSYLNGVNMNDLELGRFSYSMIGGMNDATRNKEGVGQMDYNLFGVTGLGGGDNINLRAGQYAAGNKLTLSGCNRNYTLRGQFTHATGFNRKGWAAAGMVGYRWADYNTAYIEGTFYNSFSYFLAVEKRWGDRHSLNLSTFGAPTERAQQGASTEEAYYLANSHYYNPNWGYQNGKKRNARVVHDFQPTAILTWDVKPSASQRLSTSLAYKYSMYSSSALSWGDNAADPRPDYYKNLPSSIFNIYNDNKNTHDYLDANPYLTDQFYHLTEFWQTERNRQIDWDRLYYINQQNAQNPQNSNGEALYYVERRHNDQQAWILNSTWSHSLNARHKYAVGAEVNHTKGMHYKTMDDLLGGNPITDIDKYASKDYGRYSSEAQNDLNHPNRLIGEGDRFGYDYNIYVNRAKAWANYQYTSSHWTAVAQGHMDGTGIAREGKMRNGRYANNSFGHDGQRDGHEARFLGGGLKVALTYSPNRNHSILLAASLSSNAPLARNAFVAPRDQNNFIKNLTNEDIFSAEAAYTFTAGKVSGKVGGYYTLFRHGVEQTAFYNDQQERFTYLTMTDVDRRHYGVEAAVSYSPDNHWTITALGTWSDAAYTNNPHAQISYDGLDAATNEKLNACTNPVTGAAEPLRVVADGMKVGSTPLAAVMLSVKYNINYWFFEVQGKYFDRAYLQFSQYRRLSSVLKSYAPSSFDADGNMVYDVTADELNENGGILYNADGSYNASYSPKQEKFDGGFMLDASIGKSIRLKRGKTMSINLQAQNILNNTNLRTGGYEQNRDDFYNTGEEKAYQFSKNPKYYYANGFNFFLNIGLRF